MCSIEGSFKKFFNTDWIKVHTYLYPEKATKFCEISSLHLTGTTYDKSKVEISQNFVAFSEYMNFIAPIV